MSCLITNENCISQACVSGLTEGVEFFFPRKYSNVRDNHNSVFRGQINRAMMQELKTRVDEIVSGYYSIIYNYLLGNVRYSQVQFAGNTSNVIGGNPYKNSAYGALVMHDAVCSGISDAVNCLCQALGLESHRLVTAPEDVGGQHAYNTVKIGNHWYRLDATIEIGTVPGRKIRTGRWKSQFFLIPFLSNHIFTALPYVPNCTAEYPRDLVERMKGRLESHGLSFEYNPSELILGEELQAHLKTFIVKRINDVKTETLQNFESNMNHTFKIKKVNGMSVVNHCPISNFSSHNHVVSYDESDAVELSQDPSSRFIIKHWNKDEVKVFRILSRNGQMLYELTPNQYTSTQNTEQDNYIRKRQV